jgi:IS5 family transposase
VVSSVKRAGINLKQTFAKECKPLGRKAGGYAHAKQFRRMKRVVKRQRTILGVVMREVKRKLDLSINAPLNGAGSSGTPSNPKAISALWMWLERAERIRTQQRHDKNKLYALHAPEVECIGKGKARKPYEFGVKVSLAVTHKQGLMVCGGLQHSLATAGDRPFGPEGGFFAPVFECHDRDKQGQINVCSTDDCIDAVCCG